MKLYHEHCMLMPLTVDVILEEDVPFGGKQGGKDCRSPACIRRPRQREEER